MNWRIVKATEVPSTSGPKIQFAPKSTFFLSRTVSKMNVTGAPLARVAYGATKTDHWKAEAEHYQSGDRFSHLVDDDETVVTSFTFDGKNSKAEGPPSILASATWGGVG